MLEYTNTLKPRQMNLMEHYEKVMVMKDEVIVITAAIISRIKTQSRHNIKVSTLPIILLLITFHTFTTWPNAINWHT